MTIDYKARTSTSIAFDNGTFRGALVLDVVNFEPPTASELVSIVGVFAMRLPKANSVVRVLSSEEEGIWGGGMLLH